MENKKTTSNLELSNKGIEFFEKENNRLNKMKIEHKKIMEIISKYVKGNRK